MRMERLIFEEDNQGAVMSAVVTVEELKKFRVVHSDSHQQDHPTCAWYGGNHTGSDPSAPAGAGESNNGSS